MTIMHPEMAGRRLLLLSKTQAQSAYGAMSLAIRAKGFASVEFPSTRERSNLYVHQSSLGEVLVSNHLQVLESHSCLTAFARAYSLMVLVPYAGADPD